MSRAGAPAATSVATPSRRRPSAERQALATTNDLAAYLQKSPGTIRNWRSEGIGPDWVRIGHDVRYRWADIEAWIDQQNP